MEDEPSAVPINQLLNYKRMFEFNSRLNKLSLSQAMEYGIILQDVKACFCSEPSM